MATFKIDCQDVTFHFSEDEFEVAPKFNLLLDFSYLSGSPMLQRIDSHELDKSFLVDMSFAPHLHLRLREDVYTYILRTIDLNFGFTDYLEELFVFKNDEEYFRSTDYLLKSKTIIRTEFLALSLYTKEGEQLTELGMKKPFIQIDYHLNRRHNYDIAIEEMNSFFIDSSGEKMILFGNLNERHWISNFEEMKSCLFVPKTVPSNAVIKIEMHPDGSKNFKIDIDGLKLFLHPYFYLMIDHFFREGLPVYDMQSLDKPNEYSEDPEEYPVISSTFNLNNSLICLAQNEIFDSQAVLGIGLPASLGFDFKREKIKSIKQLMWDKISKINVAEAPPEHPA